MTERRMVRVVAITGALAVVGLVALVLGGRPDPLAFAGGRRVSLSSYRGDDPTGVPAQLRRASLVERGEYLARAADCEACHTAPGGLPYAGGRAFVTPFGTLYSTNITPDRSTGIGGYSDADLIRALHQGVGRGGKRLYPAMPYASYTYMTDADVLAIKAYLFSLPPVHAPPPANQLAFPFNQRLLMGAWSCLFNADQRFKPDQDRSARWNRGAYLVEALAHCGECHTPRSFLEGLSNRRKFAGAVLDGWRAYNLTADARSGIGAWSDSDLAQYLTQGHADGHGAAAGPMGEAVDMGLSHLSNGDIAAIITYLRSVPPVKERDLPPIGAQGVQAQEGRGGRGHEIFQEACAACHGETGVSTLSAFATLPGSRAVNDPSGTNVAQIVLFGSQDRRHLMPAFRSTLSDADIAQVVNYVTGRYGASSSSLTADRVAAMRAGGLEVLPSEARTTHMAVPANVAAHPAIAQPIPFSHKMHIGVGLLCTTCHVNPVQGRDMTLPPSATCMQCHAAVDRSRPDIQRLAGLAGSGQPIPWSRVYPLLAGIRFDHGPHLRAGVQCVTCHGKVAEQDALSEVTAVTSMAVCISCHRTQRAPTACSVCHGWPTDDPEVLGRLNIPLAVPFGLGGLQPAAVGGSRSRGTGQGPGTP